MPKNIPILDTKCVAPYIATEINTVGDLQVCCEATPFVSNDSINYSKFDEWQRIHLKDLRNDLKNNIKNEHCTYCWQKDEVNGFSLRKYLNEMYQEVYDRIGIDDDESLLDTRYVHAHFGNLCNLKCIMCSPYSSSSIESEQKRFAKEYKSFYDNAYGIDRIDDPANQTFTSLFYKKLDYLGFIKEKFNKADFIYLTGGEPLMTPEAYETLNAVEQPENKTLCMTTNGTMLDPKWTNLFDKYHKVMVIVSIDGIGEKNDYIRFGSDWDIIEKNIYTLKSKVNIETRLTFVLQRTSYYTLKEIIEFAVKNNLSLHYSINNGSLHMRLNTLTPEEITVFKNQLIDLRDKISIMPSTTVLDEFLNQHEPITLKFLKDNWIQTITTILDFIDLNYVYDSHHRETFFDYLSFLDKLRGTDYRLVF